MEDFPMSPYRAPKILRPEDLALLRSTIQKQQPELLPLLDLLGVQPLTEDQREALREALADELVETGLRDDSEPNARGRHLDDIIGRLRRL